MERYLSVVKRINYIFFLVLMASLPLPRKFGHIILIVWVVSWLLELRFTKKENFCDWKALIPSLGLAAWVLWECVSILWGGHFRDCHASLLILPLILAFGVNEQYQWKQAAKAVVIGSILSCFFYGFTLFGAINHRPVLDYYCQDSFTTFHLVWFDCFLSNIKHRFFYCTILTVAIILLIILREDCWKRWGKIEGSIYLVLGCAIMLLAIIATGSRASLFTLIVLAAVFGIRQIPKRHHFWMSVGIGFCVLVGCVAIWHWHPRMQDITIEQVIHPEQHVGEVNTHNPRALIWYYALQSPKDYIGHGLGVRQAEKYLYDKYEQNNWDKGMFDHFHAHNQYLLVCMELGIVAMFLFIAYWICLPMCYPKRTRQRNFVLYLALIFGLNMLTDSLFSSMEGVVYICTLLVLASILPTSTKGCESVSSVCPSPRLS